MDANTFRTKFYYHLQYINDIKENGKISDIDTFRDTIIKYIILAKLSINEINNDDTITSKSREFADYGLDCYDLIFYTLVSNGYKTFTEEEIKKIVLDADTIDCLHKDYVCPY